MDASVFDNDVHGDGDSDLTAAYETLPNELKELINVMLFVGRSFIKVGLLVAALAWCAWAFALLLAWVSIYWLQTQLLLKLAALLKFSFECNGKPSSDGDILPQIVTPRVNGPIEDAKRSDKSTHGNDSSLTSDDFDKFEEFLNSPKEVRGQSASHHLGSSSPSETRGPLTVVHVEPTAGILTHDTTLAREPSGTTDREVVHASQSGSLWDISKNASGEPRLVTSDNRKLSSTVDSGTKTPSSRATSQRLEREERVKAKNEENENRRASEQTAWLESLMVNRSRPNLTKITQPPQQSSSNGGALRSGGAHKGYTKEQLKEAASFAAGATKGGCKVPPSRSTGFRGQNPVRLGTHLRHPQDQRVLGQQANSGPASSRTGKPVQQAESAAKNEALKRPTLEEGALPPHLRKRNAARGSRRIDETATESSSPKEHVFEAAHGLIQSTASPNADKGAEQERQTQKRMEVDDPISLQHAMANSLAAKTDHSQPTNLTSSIDTCSGKHSSDTKPSLFPDPVQMDTSGSTAKSAHDIANNSASKILQNTAHRSRGSLSRPAARSMSSQHLKEFDMGRAQPPPAGVVQAQNIISGVIKSNAPNYPHMKALFSKSDYEDFDYENTLELFDSAAREIGTLQRIDTAPSVVVDPDTPGQELTNAQPVLPFDEGYTSKSRQPSPEQALHAASSRSSSFVSQPASASEGPALSVSKDTLPDRSDKENVQQSLTKSPERESSFHRAVQVLNEQAHQRRASLHALHRTLDATANSFDPSKKVVMASSAVSSSSQVSSAPPQQTDIGNKITTNDNRDSTCASNRSSSLNAKAPAFFVPPLSKTTTGGTPYKNRPSEQSRTTYSAASSLPTTGTPVPSSNVSRTPTQAPPGLQTAGGLSPEQFGKLLPNPCYDLCGEPLSTTQLEDTPLPAEHGKVKDLYKGEQVADTQEEQLSEPERIEPIADTVSAQSLRKRERKQARAALNDAWFERETIRKRVVGSFTLEGVQILEQTTKTYNAKRLELAATMANETLSEEDKKMYPILKGADVSKPKHTPPNNGITSIKESEKEVRQPTKPAQEKKPPSLTTSRSELKRLASEAIEARERYKEARDYYKRPPAEGRAHLHDLRTKLEKRVELASKRYNKKVEAVEAAYYPDDLPDWLAKELPIYDDKAFKKTRDEWMP